MWKGNYYGFNHLLELKWIAVLYGIDWFLFWICACRHSKVMAFFSEACMKKGKWWWAICNYKQPYKSSCVSSMKLKRRIKYSLCYSESIYVHFRPNKPTLQELWTFACVMTSRKAVYNHCELENPLLFASRTSNAIVLWLRRFALLYWVDWCIL